MSVVPSRISAGTFFCTLISTGFILLPSGLRLTLRAPAEQCESAESQQCQRGRHGDRERPAPLDPLLHLRRVVEAREGFVRRPGAEELAQGLPALSYLVDEQPVLRHAPKNLPIVALEDFYSVGLVLKAAVEGSIPDNLLAHPPDPEHAGHEETHKREDGARESGAGGDLAQLVDGITGALVPLFGVAHAQEHLRVGVPLQQLCVERAGRPVHGGLVVRKETVPAHRLPAPGRLPEPDVLRVLEDLDHVVARAEAKYFERDLQRHRAGPAETRPDHLHPGAPLSRRAFSSRPAGSPRTARAASASGTCRWRSSG